MRSTLQLLVFCLSLLSSAIQAQTLKQSKPPTIVIDARKGARAPKHPDIIYVQYKPIPDPFSKKPEDRPQDAKILIFDFDQLPAKTPTINFKTLTNKILIFENCPLSIPTFNQSEWLSKTMVTPTNQIIHQKQPVGIEFGYANSNIIITFPPNKELDRRGLDDFANDLIKDLVTNPNFSPGRLIPEETKRGYIMDTRQNSTPELAIPGKTIIPFKSLAAESGIEPAHLDSVSILIIDYNTHPGFAPLWKPKQEPIHQNGKTIIYCNCPIPIQQFKGTGILPPNHPQVIPPATDEIEETTSASGTRLIRFYSVQAQSLPKAQQDAINNKVITALIRDKNL